MLLDLLFPPRATELLVRNTTTLLPYLAPHTLGNGIVILLPYDEPRVRAAILEAKFHENRQAAELLGNALAHYLSLEIADRDLYEHTEYRLVPLPGTERMAKVASALLAIPLESLGAPKDPCVTYAVIDDSTTPLLKAAEVLKEAGVRRVDMLALSGRI